MNDAQNKLFPLVVKQKTTLAKGIYSFELGHAEGAPLLPFTAGSHISVQTPVGAMRHYSLTNDPIETHRYVLGIKSEPGGRGGSASLVNKLDEGDVVHVGPPKNEFELVPAPSYILIAGGIGITPIISMARQLVRTNDAPFKLIYCTREPALTAFVDELAAPDYSPHVTVHHDNGNPAEAFEFWDIVATPTKAHIYCCGPSQLMEEIRGVTGHWPRTAIHFEDFASDAAKPRDDDTSFIVHHKSSGRKFEVPADRSIVEILRAAGENPITSCESGTCGTCKTKLLNGKVDHRDMVLSDEEKKDHIMICISRAKTGELVLDW
jgi:phthalate 4,5-dioxygenase reductase subunit